MALIKTLNSGSGLVVNSAYWRITFLSAAVTMKTVTAVISPYNSQSDCENGKPPISGEDINIVISGEDFDTYFNPLPENANHFSQAYEYIKSTAQFSGADIA